MAHTFRQGKCAVHGLICEDGLHLTFAVGLIALQRPALPRKGSVDLSGQQLHQLTVYPDPPVQRKNGGIVTVVGLAAHGQGMGKAVRAALCPHHRAGGHGLHDAAQLCAGGHCQLAVDDQLSVGIQPRLLQQLRGGIALAGHGALLQAVQHIQRIAHRQLRAGMNRHGRAGHNAHLIVDPVRAVLQLITVAVGQREKRGVRRGNIHAHNRHGQIVEGRAAGDGVGHPSQIAAIIAAGLVQIHRTHQLRADRQRHDAHRGAIADNDGVHLIELTAGIQVAAPHQQRPRLHTQIAADILHGVLGKGTLSRVYKAKGIGAAGEIVYDERLIHRGVILRRYSARTVDPAEAVQHAARGNGDRPVVDDPAKGTGSMSLIKLPRISDHAAQPQGTLYGQHHALRHRQRAEGHRIGGQPCAIGGGAVLKSPGIRRFVKGNIQGHARRDGCVRLYHGALQRHNGAAGLGAVQRRLYGIVYIACIGILRGCHAVPSENGHRRVIGAHHEGIAGFCGHQIAAVIPAVEPAAPGGCRRHGDHLAHLDRLRSGYAAALRIVCHRRYLHHAVRKRQILQPHAVLCAIDRTVFLVGKVDVGDLRVAFALHLDGSHRPVGLAVHPRRTIHTGDRAAAFRQDRSRCSAVILPIKQRVRNVLHIGQGTFVLHSRRGDLIQEAQHTVPPHLHAKDSIGVILIPVAGLQHAVLRQAPRIPVSVLLHRIHREAVARRQFCVCLLRRGGRRRHQRYHDQQGAQQRAKPFCVFFHLCEPLSVGFLQSPDSAALQAALFAFFSLVLPVFHRISFLNCR